MPRKHRVSRVVEMAVSRLLKAITNNSGLTGHPQGLSDREKLGMTLNLPTGSNMS
ncbi:MAG: hypothetical protein ACXACI_12270 [Candidatus Hodarchaeales archaeon]|jgi:hypothetical protein